MDRRSGADRRRAIILITGSARKLSGGPGESEGPNSSEGPNGLE
jgi:hypothetical protein